mmetsp:Transcript_138454/g.386197  ORF Transcript_138454/g.386197 Transcript_138454/m.386197 type:complete len:90 (+) Transcript_138454:64-333(+)
MATSSAVALAPATADLAARVAALPVAERKRHYISECVQPALEPMLAELLHKRPADPEAFMIEWLRTRSSGLKHVDAGVASCHELQGAAS